MGLAEKTFDPVVVAKSALQQKLKLGSVSGKPYTRKDILDVLSAIVNSGCGYVPYDDLIESVGSLQVDTMIEQNIIHYRPPSRYNADLQPWPESAVVTASGAHTLRAMEVFASESGCGGQT
jgi:hypothetical protein